MKKHNHVSGLQDKILLSIGSHMFNKIIGSAEMIYLIAMSTLLFPAVHSTGVQTSITPTEKTSMVLFRMEMVNRNFQY